MKTVKLPIKIEQINPWRTDGNFRFRVYDREQYTASLFKLDKLIDILIGARRVGKTSILRSTINYLLDRAKVNHGRVIYITSEIGIDRSIDLIEFISNIYGYLGLKTTKPIYLFIDEVQDIPGWQTAVKFLYDNTAANIFITGSSSLILKQETSKLTGRYSLHEILPLNFAEFLQFTNRKEVRSPLGKKELVEEYLQVGGYPEYVLNQDMALLNRIIESTLYRDLLTHYGIRNPAFLRDLLDYTSDKVGNSISAARIHRDLNVNDDTARFYLQYLQDVYLIYPLFRYGRSHKVTKGSIPKYYFNDTGILFQRSLNPKIGQLAENAVYMKLRSEARDREYPQIYYDRNSQGLEIDFINRKKGKVEVKYRSDLQEGDIVKYSGVKDLKIVVMDTELSKDFLTGYSDIEFVGAYDFLIG